MSRITALSASAPLMFTPEARTPDGGIGEWFRGAGGLRLRLGYWPADQNARGTVFVSPGRSEPIEKYYELIGDLNARGFCVVVHDWRGQGLSARLLPDRLKCHARASDELLDDFQRLLDAFEDRAPKPWLVIGHSMGGALNLATLVKGEPRIAGALLVNPMLSVKTGKHALWTVNFQVNWQVSQGHGTDYVPDLFEDPFESTFERDAISHDRERWERWREQLFSCPHLAVGSPTWGWLQFALRLGETLLRDKLKLLKKVRTPITFICSGEDTVIAKQPTRALARKIAGAQYIEVPGAGHELLIESDDYRNEALKAFDELVETVLNGGAADASDAPAEAISDTDEAAAPADTHDDTPEQQAG